MQGYVVRDTSSNIHVQRCRGCGGTACLSSFEIQLACYHHTQQFQPTAGHTTITAQTFVAYQVVAASKLTNHFAESAHIDCTCGAGLTPC